MAVGLDENGQAIISDQLVPLRLLCYDNEKKEVLYPTVTTDGKLDGTTAAALTNAVKTTGADADAVTEDYPFAEFDSITIDTKTGKITGVVKDTDQVATIGFIAIATSPTPTASPWRAAPTTRPARAAAT
jgi:hypothetical protein